MSTINITLLTATSSDVVDATGSPMVVGDTYEMYEGAAKGCAQALGVVWADAVGYSFVFAGTVKYNGDHNICTADITYSNALGEGYKRGADLVREALGGVSTLCPVYCAAKFVRPVTDE